MIVVKNFFSLAITINKVTSAPYAHSSLTVSSHFLCSLFCWYSGLRLVSLRQIFCLFFQVINKLCNALGTFKFVILTALECFHFAHPIITNTTRNVFL